MTCKYCGRQVKDMVAHFAKSKPCSEKHSKQLEVTVNAALEAKRKQDLENAREIARKRHEG